MDLVDAQQARRILDRMVGYRISPLLWAKVKRGLSAGRVQSVALRIICDREEEINAFIPEEYWTLDALLKTGAGSKPVLAKYYGKDGNRTEISNQQELEQILAELEGAEFRVTEVKRGERSKKPPLPFTTSTLQQEASKTLNFSTQKTMRLAQQLYEGIDVKGSGTVGIITYLRTDSTRVSEEAERMAAEYITGEYGEEYAASGQRDKKEGKKIQDAHEAIRPTDVYRTPSALKDSLSRDQFRLYQLIWKRFLASRMNPAKYETTNVKIHASEHCFTVAASRIVFHGFMHVYTEEEEKEENVSWMDRFEKDAVLQLEKYEHKQHFTQPVPHYTEASLVRALEELGIGRPSTYAPTITTILARRYIVKENKSLYVTELGEVVNHIMKEAFASIVDVNFTATMETLLDGVEEGSVNWKTIISNFYPDLAEAVEKAEEELEHVSIEEELSEENCELCGRQMVIKYGPHGRFLACPGFPECRCTKPYYEKIGISCPVCGKDVVLKKTKKGRKYYGCIDNPECDFMVWQKPSGVICKKCGSLMLEKGSKLVCMNEECGTVTERESENDLKEDEKQTAEIV